VYKKDGCKTEFVESFGEYGREFLNYSFKPLPTFVDKKDAYSRSFLGIELEYLEDEDCYENENLDEFHFDLYNSNEFPFLYYVKYDSSFHGPEFVFQPMSFLAVMNLYKQGYWKKFFDVKNDYYDIGSSVGMHVHIDKEQGTENVANKEYSIQNMSKIAYSLKWFYDTDRELFSKITKRKRYEYCNPNIAIHQNAHREAITATSKTFEFRFWASPKTLGRFMYCLAATEAGNIIARNRQYIDKRKIIKDMFYTIPKQIERVFKVDLAFPTGIKQLVKLTEGSE